eukprot:c20400_g1_i4 orf=486-2636(+)
MQRVMLIRHLLSSSRCVSRALPVIKLTLPIENLPLFSESLRDQRFFCAQTFKQTPAKSVIKSSAESNVRRQRSRHSISIFLQRVLDTIKVLNVLNEKPWNADTSTAVQCCQAKLTVNVVAEVIKICADLDTALEFFEWWRAMDDNEPDSHVYVALMHRLGNVGRIEEMEAVASESESDGKVTVATFTVQLASYKRVGNLDKALRTWRRMEKFGIKPNLLSYTTMIDALASMKLYDEAGDLYLLFLWERFYPNVRTLTVLIHHLAEAGKLDAAVAIFNDLLKVNVKPNAMTFASLMKGYASVGNMNAVVSLVRQFKDVGHRPHQDTFKSFFHFLLGEQRVDDSVKVMLELWPEYSMDERKGLVAYYQAEAKRDVCNQVCVQDEGVESMSDASDASDDEEDNEKMSSYSASLWNFTGFVRCLTPWSPATAAALEHADVKWDGHLVSEIMKRITRVDIGWKFFNWVEGQQGFNHDKFTYMRMIQLLLTEGNFVTVKQLLVEAQSKQLNLSLHTYNKILKFCGLKYEADVALDVFSLLENTGLRPDPESYNNLIHVLHKCGRYWRAASVFAEMQKAGFSPSATIYSFVICGFAEAGHMKYAKAYYKRMRASGFEPSERLYKAFISGFYQSGRLDKAEQVFQQMKKDGMVPSGQAYDLMVKVFKKAGKTVELSEIQCKRVPQPTAKKLEKQRNFDKYLKFYCIFVESFAAESDDVRMYATG